MAKAGARRPSLQEVERTRTNNRQRKILLQAIPTIFGSLCQPRSPIVNQNARFQLKSLKKQNGCRRQVFSVPHAEALLKWQIREAQSKVRESVAPGSGVGDRVIDI